MTEWGVFTAFFTGSFLGGLAGQLVWRLWHKKINVIVIPRDASDAEIRRIYDRICSLVRRGGA